MQFLDVSTPVSIETAALVIFLSIVYYFLKDWNILPGPRGLPFFGLYPFLNHDTCHLQLEEYGKKYGDLFSFTSFGNLIINLGSAKAIREVHVNKSDCFERLQTFNILMFFLKDGYAMSNGESWKLQRKFFVQSFKEYGLTAMRENTVAPVIESIPKTIEDIISRKGVPFNICELLIDKCTGTLRKVLFGEDGISDEKIREINRASEIILEGLTGAKLLLLGPVAKFAFNTLSRNKLARFHKKVLDKLLMETVKIIESKMDPDYATCVVEDYYREQRIRRQKNDPTWKYFTDKALVSSLIQITSDGILNVSYFIGCFLYALVEHPEEQEKIYEELMEVVGPGRLPTPEDRNNLHYTKAFMTEVMRTSNFFSLITSLECTKETEIRGYRIPKGSITLLNMWQCHHDANAYENPYKFDPSRYIPKAGKPKPEYPVDFGIGKRACSGEPFVMLQSYLFLTSIVKNFTISDPNPSSKSGRFLMTGVMELSFVPRKEK